jgi:hypothetical protein
MKNSAGGAYIAFYVCAAGALECGSLLPLSARGQPAGRGDWYKGRRRGALCSIRSSRDSFLPPGMLVRVGRPSR